MSNDEREREGLQPALGIHGEQLVATCQGAPTVVQRLRETHRNLWKLEDRARSRYADDHEIADIKRAIDQANAHRHRQIDELDNLLVAPGSGPATGRLYSQTPGELCDRLIILELKALQLQALAESSELPEEERERCRARLSLQKRWHAHLQDCLVDQLSEHAAQRARLPPRAEIKLYNDPLLNDVTRREGVV